MEPITLELTAMAHGGAALGRHDKRVIFVPYALPGETVRAEITDDGRGKTDEETPGSGLSGLAERVATFGDGGFEARPLQDGGFRLRIDLPLEKAPR